MQTVILLLNTFIMFLKASEHVYNNKEAKTLEFLDEIHFISQIPEKLQKSYDNFIIYTEQIKMNIKNDKRFKRGLFRSIIQKTKSELDEFTTNWLAKINELCLETHRILNKIQKHDGLCYENTKNSCLTCMNEFHNKLTAESQLNIDNLSNMKLKNIRSGIQILKSIKAFEKLVDDEYAKFLSYYGRKKVILVECLVSRYRKNTKTLKKYKHKREYFLEKILYDIDTGIAFMSNKKGDVLFSDVFVTEKNQIWDLYVNLNFFNTVSQDILFEEVLNYSTECSTDFLKLKNDLDLTMNCKTIYLDYCDKVLNHCMKYLQFLHNHEVSCEKYSKIVNQLKDTSLNALSKFENILMAECGNLDDPETALFVLEESYINFSERLMREFSYGITDLEIVLVCDISSLYSEYKNDLKNIVHDEYCDLLLSDILSLKAVFTIVTHVSCDKVFTNNCDNEYTRILEALVEALSIDIRRCYYKLRDIQNKDLNQFSCMNIEMLFYMSSQLTHIREIFDMSASKYENSIVNAMEEFKKHIVPYQNTINAKYSEISNDQNDLKPVYEDSLVTLNLGETPKICEDLYKLVFLTYLQFFNANFAFLDDESNFLVISNMIKTWMKCNRGIAHDDKLISDFLGTQQFFKVISCFEYQSAIIKNNLKQEELDPVVCEILYGPANSKVNSEEKNGEVQTTDEEDSNLKSPRKLEFFDYDLHLDTILEEESTVQDDKSNVLNKNDICDKFYNLKSNLRSYNSHLNKPVSDKSKLERSEDEQINKEKSQKKLVDLSSENEISMMQRNIPTCSQITPYSNSRKSVAKRTDFSRSVNNLDKIGLCDIRWADFHTLDTKKHENIFANIKKQDFRYKSRPFLSKSCNSIFSEIKKLEYPDSFQNITLSMPNLTNVKYENENSHNSQIEVILDECNSNVCRNCDISSIQKEDKIHFSGKNCELTDLESDFLQTNSSFKSKERFNRNHGPFTEFSHGTLAIDFYKNHIDEAVSIPVIRWGFNLISENYVDVLRFFRNFEFHIAHNITQCILSMNSENRIYRDCEINCIDSSQNTTNCIQNQKLPSIRIKGISDTSESQPLSKIQYSAAQNRNCEESRINMHLQKVNDQNNLNNLELFSSFANDYSYTNPSYLNIINPQNCRETQMITKKHSFSIRKCQNYIVNNIHALFGTNDAYTNFHAVKTPKGVLLIDDNGLVLIPYRNTLYRSDTHTRFLLSIILYQYNKVSVITTCQSKLRTSDLTPTAKNNKKTRFDDKQFRDYKNSALRSQQLSSNAFLTYQMFLNNKKEELEIKNKNHLEEKELNSKNISCQNFLKQNSHSYKFPCDDSIRLKNIDKKASMYVSKDNENNTLISSGREFHRKCESMKYMGSENLKKPLDFQDVHTNSLSAIAGVVESRRNDSINKNIICYHQKSPKLSTNCEKIAEWENIDTEYTPFRDSYFSNKHFSNTNLPTNAHCRRNHQVHKENFVDKIAKKKAFFILPALFILCGTIMFAYLAVKDFKKRSL